MSTDVRRITGTLLYAPVSVLRGEPHTVSSQLEGLFLSVLNLSCNGNTHARDIRSHKLELWEALPPWSSHPSAAHGEQHNLPPI